MICDEQVARDYEAWYQQGFGRWAVEREHDLLARQLAVFPHPRTLLEVGCGTGHFCSWFAVHGLEVTGLDVSPAMLADARRRGGPVTYLQGDALALPFDEQSFDLVACITVLEFLPDVRHALREAQRVARQGLVLGVLNRRSLLDWSNRRRGRQPEGVLAQARRYSTGELAGLVRRATCDHVAVWTAWRTTSYPWHLPLNGLRLPWGEYLGMTVRWRE